MRESFAWFCVGAMGWVAWRIMSGGDVRIATAAAVISCAVWAAILFACNLLRGSGKGE